jgi:hypothetical protein
MSIRNCPKKIETFIQKGADVKKDQTIDEWTQISFRLPKKFLTKIDYLKNKRPGITRNGWILEAIQDKFKFINCEEEK